MKRTKPSIRKLKRTLFHKSLVRFRFAGSIFSGYYKETLPSGSLLYTDPKTGINYPIKKYQIIPYGKKLRRTK